MKLTKKNRALLEYAGSCSSLGTQNWRSFVPLSNAGLVTISEGGGFFDMRSIRITEKGRDTLRALTVP